MWDFISPEIFQPNCATTSCHGPAAAVSGLDFSTPDSGYMSLTGLWVWVAIPADASQGQGEEHCPLCVAMHSALPATMQVVPEPVQQIAQTLYTHVLVAPEKLWSFAMFSRPPPGAARTLAASSASSHSHDALLAVMTAG